MQGAFGRLVVCGGYRPGCHRLWPSEWSDLMRSCWDKDIQKRKPFTEVSKMLSSLAEHLRADKGEVDLDNSVRGTMSNKLLVKQDTLERSTNVDNTIVTDRKRGNSLNGSTESEVAPQARRELLEEV